MQEFYSSNFEDTVYVCCVGQIQRVVVKTQSESQTTDIYIIVGAVAGAVVVVIILVVVIAVLSFCCLPQRKYDVAGGT